MNWKWQIKNAGLFVLFILGTRLLVDASPIWAGVGAAVAWMAIQHAEPPKKEAAP